MHFQIFRLFAAFTFSFAAIVALDVVVGWKVEPIPIAIEAAIASSSWFFLVGRKQALSDSDRSQANLKAIDAFGEKIIDEMTKLGSGDFSVIQSASQMAEENIKLTTAQHSPNHKLWIMLEKFQCLSETSVDPMLSDAGIIQYEFTTMGRHLVPFLLAQAASRRTGTVEPAH